MKFSQDSVTCVRPVNAFFLPETINQSSFLWVHEDFLMSCTQLYLSLFTGMNIWNILLFWSVGLLYLIIDIFAWPKWMARYKVQPKAILDKKMLRSVRPSINSQGKLFFLNWHRYSQLITVTLYNQLFVAIPFSLLGYYVLKFQGTSPPIRELPSFFRLVRDFALFIPIQEVFAYYTHR